MIIIIKSSSVNIWIPSMPMQTEGSTSHHTIQYIYILFVYDLLMNCIVAIDAAVLRRVLFPLRVPLAGRIFRSVRSAELFARQQTNADRLCSIVINTCGCGGDGRQSPVQSENIGSRHFHICCLLFLSQRSHYCLKHHKSTD